MSNIFSNSKKKAVDIHLFSKSGLKAWSRSQSDTVKKWIKTTGFVANPGDYCLIPSREGSINEIILGVSEPFEIWDTGNLARSLPRGHYQFVGIKNAGQAALASLGWALGSYRYDRYRKPLKLNTTLKIPSNCDSGYVTKMANATCFVRDLINTPAEDLGPTELEFQVRNLADRYEANVRVVKGKQLLSRNFPAIYAIGRASDDPPRLINLSWGNPKDPKVTLVGKGVCFDTGGLDIKTASGMKFMKKDMGGAAHVLGLAMLLMEANLKLRLRVLIPAVENSVSANSIRPMDVLNTRSGKTIEIGHTDAEGRVILADALYEAARERPDLILDFATLTGAARIALGSELPALFTNNEKLAEVILAASYNSQDPVWRLPLWSDYRRHIIGKTANLTNSADTGFGGAITAALFLNEFIQTGTPWAHLDLMAWNMTTRRGRPEGGEAMGLRAIYHAIRDWLEPPVTKL
ncbi:MAG: leucyl aminopeptidase family protein [Pseudomonadota bacterium]|nr:leucyl aminopeptidase family protein [Pseudomonadota bacterium]